MTKIDELKQLLIKTAPDNPAYERLKIVLEAFFGLRQEYIVLVKGEVYKKFNVEKLLNDYITSSFKEENESRKEHDERVAELRAKYEEEKAKADKEVLDQVNDTIEKMLTHHKNIRKLNEYRRSEREL